MISCAQHDYLELACMYAYHISVRTKNGFAVEGIATDIAYVDGQHCLFLELQMGDVPSRVSVVIAQITTLTALTKNPYFTTIVAD
jgi:Rho-binding antiterminator